MSILNALLSIGVQASQIGGDPTNEAEYLDRVTVHNDKRPSWSEVSAQLLVVRQEELKTKVNGERDDRINGGFVFEGKTFASDEKSRDLIQKAHGRASTAIFAETATPGDLRWDDPDDDFSWPDVDGNMMTMDAPTCVDFGEAASLYEIKMIKKASALKKLSPIPENYADGSYWS